MSSTKQKVAKTGASSSPVPTPGVLQGQDLELLTRSKQAGGIGQELQRLVVPEIIARCGMRWWNAQSGAVVGSVVRNVVVQHDLVGFGAAFVQLYEANPASLKAILRALRVSHIHCAKNHHDRLAQLVARLIAPSKDERVDYGKQKVFGVKSSAPILADDHPVIKYLWNQDALPPPLTSRLAADSNALWLPFQVAGKIAARTHFSSSTNRR